MSYPLSHRPPPTGVVKVEDEINVPIALSAFRDKFVVFNLV